MWILLILLFLLAIPLDDRARKVVYCYERVDLCKKIEREYDVQHRNLLEQLYDKELLYQALGKASPDSYNEVMMEANQMRSKYARVASAAFNELDELRSEYRKAWVASGCSNPTLWGLLYPPSTLSRPC